MKINLRYKSAKLNQKRYNLAIFISENIDYKALKKVFSKNNIPLTNDLVKILKDFNIKQNIFDLNLDLNKKIILIKIKNNYKNSDFENLGAELCNFLREKNIQQLFFKFFLDQFIHFFFCICQSIITYFF